MDGATGRDLRDGAFDEADIANIVEKIETLGRSEESALESSYVVLCTHLLEAIHQPERTSRSRRASTSNSRLAISEIIRKNPSLKPKRDAAFREAYADARKIASLETGLSIARFPTDPPFTRERAEAEDYRPGRLDRSRGRGSHVGPPQDSAEILEAVRGRAPRGEAADGPHGFRAADRGKPGGHHAFDSA